jgi:DNA polymerase-3 subunit gamma/tau
VVEQRAERAVSRDPEPAPIVEAAPAAPATSGAQLSLADVRRIWPDLLEAVKKMRRFTWILLSQNAQVIGIDATSLTVGFKTAGARDSFVGGGSEEILRQAAIDVIGADWKVEAIVDPSADPGAGIAPVVTRTAAQASVTTPSEPASEVTSAPAWLSDEDDPADDVAAPAPPPAAPTASAARPAPETIASARSNIAPTRTGDAPTRAPDTRDAEAHPDDPDLEESGIDGAELLRRELGATVIDEIPHE